jgi:hypothetical protein
VIVRVEARTFTIEVDTSEEDGIAVILASMRFFVNKGMSA